MPDTDQPSIEVGHVPPAETAATYLARPEPEWLPRLREDMAKEIAEDPEMKQLTTWLGWPEKAQQVRKRAAEVAVALAASYLHEKDAEIRDFKAKFEDMEKARFYWESPAETEKANRENRDCEIERLKDLRNGISVAGALLQRQSEISGLRKAMSRAETTIAARDRELSELRAELRKAHEFIGVQALAALGIDEPEDDRG